MWTLALGGIFLAAVEACVFCRFPDRELSGCLARLCSQMEVQWKDCEVSWTFSAFALGKIRHPGMGLATVTPAPNGLQVASQLCLSAISSVHSPLWTHFLLPSGRASLDPGKGPRTSFQVNEGITLSLPISTDDASLNKITEKTHRVLRVVGEVKGEGTTKEGGGGVGKGGGQMETGERWGGAGCEGGGEPALLRPWAL